MECEIVPEDSYTIIGFLFPFLPSLSFFSPCSLIENLNIETAEKKNKKKKQKTLLEDEKKQNLLEQVSMVLNCE